MLTAGEEQAAALLRRVGGLGETARELAYRLYVLCDRKKWAIGGARLQLARRRLARDRSPRCWRRSPTVQLAEHARLFEPDGGGA